MNDFTKDDFLKRIIEQEKIFSIQLDFEDLVEREIVERKKGTKWTYAILKPDEFPMEAIKQSKSFTQITTKTKDNEVTKVYIKFPTEKQRLKALNDYRTMREKLSK